MKSLKEEVEYYMSKNYTYSSTIEYLKREGYTEEEVKNQLKAYIKLNPPGLDTVSFGFLIVHLMLSFPLLYFTIKDQNGALILLILGVLVWIFTLLTKKTKADQKWALITLTGVALAISVILVWLFYSAYEAQIHSHEYQWLSYLVLGAGVFYLIIAAFAYKGIFKYLSKK